MSMTLQGVISFLGQSGHLMMLRRTAWKDEGKEWKSAVQSRVQSRVQSAVQSSAVAGRKSNVKIR